MDAGFEPRIGGRRLGAHASIANDPEPLKARPVIASYALATRVAEVSVPDPIAVHAASAQASVFRIARTNRRIG
jgi:hypothetical protein